MGKLRQYPSFPLPSPPPNYATKWQVVEANCKHVAFSYKILQGSALIKLLICQFHSILSWQLYTAGSIVCGVFSDHHLSVVSPGLHQSVY